MAFTDGFDIGNNLIVDWASNYISSALKVYAPGFSFDQELIDFGDPYISRSPLKCFYSGLDAVRNSIESGNTYLPDIKRYKITGYNGAVEASTLSRLLRPEDNGVDISFFNLDQQREIFIANY
jgi:hypothetical protein